MLRFGTEDDEGLSSAVEFCRDAGLPVVEKDVEEGCKNKASLFVVMKSGPISVKSDEAIRRMCIPGRLNDAFVFGYKLERNDDKVEMRLEQKCEIGGSVVDDWEDRDLNDNNDDQVIASVTRKIKSRLDEDEVSIPSSGVIRSLLMGCKCFR